MGTVQSLIAATSAGDVVALDDGEHVDVVVITRPVILRGSSATIIRGSSLVGAVLTIEAPRVIIRDLTIVQPNGSGIAVQVVGKAYPQFHNVRIVGGTIEGECSLTGCDVPPRNPGQRPELAPLPQATFAGIIMCVFAVALVGAVLLARPQRVSLTRGGTPPRYPQTGVSTHEPATPPRVIATAAELKHDYSGEIHKSDGEEALILLINNVLATQDGAQLDCVVVVGGNWEPGRGTWRASGEVTLPRLGKGVVWRQSDGTIVIASPTNAPVRWSVRWTRGKAEE